MRNRARNAKKKRLVKIYGPNYVPKQYLVTMPLDLWTVAEADEARDKYGATYVSKYCLRLKVMPGFAIRGRSCQMGPLVMAALVDALTGGDGDRIHEAEEFLAMFHCVRVLRRAA